MGPEVYDSQAFIASFQGIILNTGAPEGDFIEIKRGGPAFKMEKGAAPGAVARVKSNDRTAEITVKLMKTSPVNDLLSTIFLTDQEAPVGAPGIGVFVMKDLNGTESHLCPRAWIAAAPDRSIGQDAGVNEWVFHTNEIISVFGGNFPG
jgi:hypothetical protein